MNERDQLNLKVRPPCLLECPSNHQTIETTLFKRLFRRVNVVDKLSLTHKQRLKK
jgi:hypothetical protein